MTWLDRWKEKIEAKINHYREKVALLEMNFKNTMKDYVKYNSKWYQLEIDKDYINETTSNLKAATEKLNFYLKEKEWYATRQENDEMTNTTNMISTAWSTSLSINPFLKWSQTPRLFDHNSVHEWRSSNFTPLNNESLSKLIRPDS